jgi:hypothetical protein
VELLVTAGELVVRFDSCGLPYVVRPNGAGYRARCPAHADHPRRRRWSLVIAERPDGQRILHCFAGCHIREIREALALPIEAFDGWQGYRYSRVGGPSTNSVSGGSSDHLLRKTTLLGPDLAMQRGFPLPELLAAHAHGDLVPWFVRLWLPPRAGAAMRSVAEDMELQFGLCRAAGLERPAIAFGGEHASRRGTAHAEDVLARLVAAGSVVRVRPPRPARPRVRFADGRVVRRRPARAAVYAMGEGAVVAAPSQEEE